MTIAFSDNHEELVRLHAAGTSALAAGRAERGGPIPAGGPASLSPLTKADPLPHHGIGDKRALTEAARALACGSADPTDPMCAGHLQCPPLAVAVAADAVVAALNQSMDSWDQAPTALEIERRVVESLAELVGYDSRSATGVLTSGGTESNLMGLLLARSSFEKPEQMRIVCSDRAHFSVERGAALLGLCEDEIITIPTDATQRMDPGELKDTLAALTRQGRARPVVVATAGTTDTGSIDPAAQIATVARDFGAWLHVDAAYGGGALLSDRLAPLLAGLDQADSVALDFHKLGWQPIPAGVFLTARSEDFAPLAHRAAYLNPVDDDSAGFPSRLGLSLRTSRRADAVRLAVTLRAHGREGLGRMVDQCRDLALYAARQISAHPRLQLLMPPELTTVVFSFQRRDLNAALRRRLLTAGSAVIGRADICGETWLKLTLLDPQTTPHRIDRLLDLVVAAGEEEDR